MLIGACNPMCHPVVLVVLVVLSVPVLQAGHEQLGEGALHGDRALHVLYDNFDNVLDRFLRALSGDTPPHMRRVLRAPAYRVLIGASNPMLCPIN